MPLTTADKLRLRQAALGWALQTSVQGEDHERVLERAYDYEAFVLQPLEDEDGPVDENGLPAELH